MHLRVVVGAVLALLCASVPAQAATAPDERWLPNVVGATWTYGWSDTGYSNVTTLETYTVTDRTEQLARYTWATDDANNPPGAIQSAGTIDYRYSDTGIFNVNWNSTPPPPQFPVLCANASQCGNSIASSHYIFIWGTRTPLLAEPLRQGSTWPSTGGQGNDVQAVNRYMGRERVVVPAFPLGVLAAKVESDITQVGAIGDPYGSGLRTTWWVYGVGPVKSVLRHAGGELTMTELHATSLPPKPLPSERDYMPLRKGDVMRFRWTNSKHMKRASRQQFTVAEAVTNTARVDVQELSGPIVVRGTYLFSTGNSGITNVSAATRAASRVKFPKLGPKTLPSNRRRRFFTPIDLMTFGYNPVLTAFPQPKDTWSSKPLGRDRRNYGVTGTSRVVGFQKVKTPAGTFSALLVESKLTQKGFPFGSGTRRMWFAAGRGLVKLEFRHRDGSVSRVVRLPRG